MTESPSAPRWMKIPISRAFPYAIGAMRECIAGLYQNDYLVFILKLLIFFVAGILIGLVLRPSLKGVNKYMNEQLEDTEMM